MKILYIHGGGDTIGGIETYLARSLKYHRLYEPYVAIVRYGRFYEYLRGRGVSNLIDLKGGRLREISKTIRAIYNAAKFIKKNSIKVVVAHGTHSWVYGGIISKICGVKSIFYVHGDIKKADFRSLIGGVALRIRPTLYVANSEFTARSVARLLKGDVKVNYPASDLEEFDSMDDIEAKRKLREEFNIPKNKLIFPIIGRIQDWKGQDIAILAFKNMKNKGKACLLIIGGCTFKNDRPYYHYLRKLAGEEECIIFTGFRNDIPLITKGSDVIIHASRNPEPFGIVVVEGMMAKKPVLASAHGGPLEIIKNGEDGFLYQPEDYEGLAKIMDMLVENELLCRKISNKAYEKAKNKFDMEVSVSRLEKIISGIK